MSANGEHVQRLITDKAADWFIANRAAPTRKEQEAFAAWLQASPVHIEEYLSVGVEHFIIGGRPALESIYEFGEGVMPYFKGRKAEATKAA